MDASDSKRLSSSLEDYLEAILLLTRERQVARAKEIGAQMQVNRSSVTTALQALARRGLVNYSPYDYITLTEEGKQVAEDVARRHAVLLEFIEKVLGVRGEQANRAACGMEHAISGIVLERLVSFMNYVNRCPSGIALWEGPEGFRCSGGASGAESCPTCKNRPASKAARVRPGRWGKSRG